jgi:hypothetical protein
LLSGPALDDGLRARLADWLQRQGPDAAGPAPQG